MTASGKKKTCSMFDFDRDVLLKKKCMCDRKLLQYFDCIYMGPLILFNKTSKPYKLIRGIYIHLFCQSVKSTFVSFLFFFFYLCKLLSLCCPVLVFLLSFQFMDLCGLFFMLPVFQSAFSMILNCSVCC